MQITSPSFEHNQPIPVRYTCDGENEHPPLEISDVPKGTQSLLITVHDPDAVLGDFTHWLLWNIDPHTTAIPAGMIPAGAIEGKNDKGKNEYTGPCPPEGTGFHHYHFVLSALDMTLNLPLSATRKDVFLAIEGHELARAALVGLYINGGSDRDPEGQSVPVTGNI